MYNWYDNFTLEAVKPRFISAVDNGNLVCALWTVKQGCLGAITSRFSVRRFCKACAIIWTPLRKFLWPRVRTNHLLAACARNETAHRFAG